MAYEMSPQTNSRIRTSRFSRFSGRWKSTPPINVKHFDVHVRPNIVLWILLGIVGLLTAANVAMHTAAHVIDRSFIQPGSKLVNFFDLNHEGNLPTWYQANMLLFCGLLLLLVTMSYARQKLWSHGAYWFVLGVGFCYLSLDETVSIHETIGPPIQSALEIEGGIFYFAWVIPATIGVVILFFSFIPFLRSVSVGTRNRFLIAGAIYVLGTVIVEALSGAYVSAGDRGDSFAHKMITSFEELLEMLGIVLFMHAVLNDLATHPISVHLGLCGRNNLRSQVPPAQHQK
jgi:hypothetical protein